MRVRMLVMMSLVATALVVLIAACGVPKSGGFSPIPLGNIPDPLTETTTTTTIPTTTSTIEPIVTTTTLMPTPTTNPTEPVALYFVTVSGDQLASSPQNLPFPPGISSVFLALQQGPGVDSLGLRTAIPKNSDFRTSRSRGVLTVDLDADFFDRMDVRADERLAIGQIVLTLTNLNLSGVSQVRFTMNDQPIAVPLGNGEPSDPTQVLVMEDYEDLLDTSPPPTTSTTSTTTTTTTTATTIAETTTIVATTVPAQGITGTTVGGA